MKILTPDWIHAPEGLLENRLLFAFEPEKIGEFFGIPVFANPEVPVDTLVILNEPILRASTCQRAGQ